MMKFLRSFDQLKRMSVSVALAMACLTAHGQNNLAANGHNEPAAASDAAPAVRKRQVVKITGVRFAYPLIQHWIDRFNETNPDVQVIIEYRGSSDPAQYDILAEAYEQPEEISKNREYVYIARYAVLPVANSRSAFAKIYAEKGVNTDLLKQLYFHDIYADKEKQKEIKAPYTVYTRLQKAGAPTVFAHYFGYEQKDINGKAIAGADEHLLKGLLRDSTGISYAPLPLIYDRESGKPVAGITVLPVDLNGNGRTGDDEKFYADLPDVTKHLEGTDAQHLHNIPLAYLHLSLSKLNASPAAVSFLQWVISNGRADLHSYGFLQPEAGKPDAEKFSRFAAAVSR